jgi:hypothetical protein
MKPFPGLYWDDRKILTINTKGWLAIPSKQLPHWMQLVRGYEWQKNLTRLPLNETVMVLDGRLHLPGSGEGEKLPKNKQNTDATY